jgi:hypothetical protein
MGRGSGRRAVWRWAALAVVVVVGSAACGGGDSDSAGFDDVLDPATQTTVSGDCPLRDHLAADAAGTRRRGVPVPDGYAFLEARPGGCEPVRFNPCEPVHYVVNDALAPVGADRDLEEAFRRLSDVTGMTFVNDGRTDETVADIAGRTPYQPDRYGQRWAPILIVWDHGRNARLDPTNPGGGRPFNAGGVYVGGFLVLNVDAVNSDRRPLPTGFGPGATWGRVLLHELAHILGLGHVRNPQHLMFEELGGQAGAAEFAEGDRTGLRLVGREAGCLETPPAPTPRPR